MVQLQKQYDEIEKRDAVVIAISQEDKDLKSHGGLPEKIKPSPRFDVVADLNRKATKRYHRTTAYLIDKEGVVQQVFPMLIRSRPSWDAIFAEMDRVAASRG